MSATEGAYPVPLPPEGEEDPRFTTGFLLHVSEVLERHGYPAARSGADFVELGQALYRFIYGERR